MERQGLEPLLVTDQVAIAKEFAKPDRFQGCEKGLCVHVRKRFSKAERAHITSHIS